MSEATFSRVPTEQELLNRVQSRLDNFATFTWRGKRSWDDFHMFIISKVGDLKFYNGPTFSNEYTKPQYQSNAGNLTGITFNTQQISFKVGMYYFNINLYREALEWLNPYEINYLGFSFSPIYNYLVKLSKITDSQRIVIDRSTVETIPEETYRYYTEITLTFDILGENCVRGITPYEFTCSVKPNTDYPTLQCIPDSITGNITQMNRYYTDLDSPLVCNIQLILNKQNTDTDPAKVRLTLKALELINDSWESTTLFEIGLQNLTTAILPATATYEDNIYVLNLTYDSETGLLFETYGDDSRKLLSLLSSTSKGQSLVEYMTSMCFALPGKIGTGWTNTDTRLQSKWKFELEVKNMNLATYTTEIINPTSSAATTTTHQSSMQIICYPRTNVI